MPMVVWGLLTKSAEDPTKIEEEIDARIADHNADPNAHGLSGMALYAHRTGDVLDHLDEAVRNIKIAKRARAFTAIVDIGGQGDYTDIQSAIDYVNSLGGGKILILPGTYTPTASIVLYTNVSLIGIDRDSVIIDFGDTANRIEAIGDTAPYSTGTISVTYNSKTVIGSGTAWLANVSADEYIKIGEFWHKIAEVVSDTELTLETKYRGATQSGLSYRIANFYYGIDIENLKVINSSAVGGAGVHFRYVMNSKIINCIFENDRDGVWIRDCDKITILNNDISDSPYNGIRIVNSIHISVNFNTIKDNANDGILVDGATYSEFRFNKIASGGVAGIGTWDILHSIIEGNLIDQRGRDYGIYFGGAQYVSVIGNVIRKAAWSGIFFEVEARASSYNIITGNVICDNGGYGIDINASTFEKNIVTSNQLRNNTAGAINDLGTGTIVANNITT